VGIQRVDCVFRYLQRPFMRSDATDCKESREQGIDRGLIRYFLPNGDKFLKNWCAVPAPVNTMAICIILLISFLFLYWIVLFRCRIAKFIFYICFRYFVGPDLAAYACEALTECGGVPGILEANAKRR